MKHQRGIVFGIALIMFSGEALAWQAQDTIKGTVIEVVWPLRPSDIAKNGNHEVQYRIGTESNIRLGEVNPWLTKCYGEYCPSKQTKTFELNTFSNHGLMYLFPLETP
jgi:hypothetical protein